MTSLEAVEQTCLVLSDEVVLLRRIMCLEQLSNETERLSKLHRFF